MINFRFAFQGGGANFITLLAAAKAVHDLLLEEKDSIRLDKLAGTSAGSIVASILALEIDPELIRNYLRQHGQTDFKKIIVMPAKPDDWKLIKIKKWGKKIGTMLAGQPFFDFEKIETFIGTLHNQDAVRKDFLLADVKVPLILTSSDLLTGEVSYWRSEVEKSKESKDQIKLARAVANSSSIPLVFKSFAGTSQTHFVDGGLVENFPLEQLTDNFPSERVIGFSFENEPEKDLNTPIKYLSAVLSAMINSNIKNSSRFVPADNIIKLPYEFGVLDFDAALTEGVGHLFDKVRDATYYKMKTIITREKQREHKKNTQTRFSKNFDVKKSAAAIFDRYHTKNPKILVAESEWTLNSLLPSIDRRAVDYTMFRRRYEVERPENANDLVMRVHLFSLTNQIDLTMNEVIVSDEKGQALEFDPLIGDIELFADDYLIPIYLFIDLRKLDSDVRKLTISHVDYSRDRLAAFMMPDRQGEKKKQSVAVFCSYPKFEKVIWNLHIPDQVYQRCEFTELTSLEENVNASRFVRGTLIENYVGGHRTPPNFTTVRWESLEPALEDEAAGFCIVEKAAI